MATVTTITGDLAVTGTITSGTGIDRSQILRQDNVSFPIPHTLFRVWDAMHTNLPGTGSSDDLGVGASTFGTNFPWLSTQDLNAAGAITQRARILIPVPDNYIAGSNFFFTVEAGMLTAVASVSATVDVELFSYGGNRLVNGADLITTSATTINSTTLAIIRFTANGVSPALEPGEFLDARITIAANSATASTHHAIIAHTYLELPIKA